MRKYQINFLDPDKKPLIIEAESFKEAVEKAVEEKADLSAANLRGADFYGADLSGSNLRGTDLYAADLRGTNLYGVDMRRTDLSAADLRGADLRGADLSGSNLRGTDLYAADLRGTNLDYSVWPLWCGSLDVKIDKRIFCQLLYHALRAGASVEDEEVQALRNNPDVLKLANQFHRAEECGKLEPRQGEVKK